MSANKYFSASIPRRVFLRAARGFSLVSAIFLLVVLAALGVAIVNVSSVQHTSSALDVMGAQAYQAARAGIEWGLFQRHQSPGAYCTNAAAPQTTTFALPSASSLGRFTVTVTCTFTPYGGGASAPQATATIVYNNLTRIATVTTAAPHDVLPAQQVTISGASPGAYNGTFTIDAVTSAVSFTYLLPTDPGGPATVQGTFTSSPPGLDRRQIIANACNVPVAGGCPNPNPSSRIDYVERELQVEF